MSRHSAKLDRTDGISSSAERQDGISVSAEPLSRIDASLEPNGIPFSFKFNKDGSIELRAERLDSIECTFTYSDRPDISKKYLEIDPEVIWVWPNLESYNDVLSNVTWMIN